MTDAEMHTYEDERGDDVPDGWGVYRVSCTVCGKPIIAVAPVGCLTDTPLCRAHDPSPSAAGVVA